MTGYREDKSEKIDPTLIPISMIRRVAEHYTKWGERIGKWNWMWFSKEQWQGCKASAYRHFLSRQLWEEDEDHMSALVFNLFAYEVLKSKFKDGNKISKCKSNQES